MLKDFYKSHEWESFRDVYLSELLLKEGELKCSECGKPIVRRYDGILHHKIELTESNYQDVNISLNPDNIQLVCHWCHDRIHERWGHQVSRHIYLVYGCPCSGKRAYVDSVKGSKDIVLDIDAIYSCLGDGQRGILKSDMFAIYNLMRDRIKVRAGKWSNAWVLTTAKTSGELSRLDVSLGGCEFIHIERPIEECRAEALNRGEDWVKWLDEWIAKG